MQIIFKYPNQAGIGLAVRQDNQLIHRGFIFMDAVPKLGDGLFEGVVTEVLYDKDILKECFRMAYNEIEAVVVLT